jgi:hypothetical protein
LTSLGVIIPLFLVAPENMIRTDGTKVAAFRHPSWYTELKGLVIALRTDPYIVLLFPMFFASNWFTTWREFSNNPSINELILNRSFCTEFNDYNLALFNIVSGQTSRSNPLLLTVNFSAAVP